ncbi:hypothetical protein [Vibrio parahaemolyticus]|uniref:hypothetical protein n=1 Tax=Vibrio parahaemolyticus TaxID=670 RepID=UPI0023EAD2AF|nr:hypothetical protein [Vibrio parahaemolyticus]
MELANSNEQERPPLAVEDRVLEALKRGLNVVASIRGFRVALTPVVFFYIELTAIDTHNNDQEFEIGFWPGMTNELSVAEETLNEIKIAHPEVQILHMKDPVFLRKDDNQVEAGTVGAT